MIYKSRHILFSGLLPLFISLLGVLIFSFVLPHQSPPTNENQVKAMPPSLMSNLENDNKLFVLEDDPMAGKNLVRTANLKLGNLSMFWESGHRGSGAISTSANDPGGPSYGLYQISLKKGYIQKFLNREGRYFRSVLGPHSIGSDEFNEVWNQISEMFPTEFHKAQHDYVRRTHYDKYVVRVRRQLSLNIYMYSDVLKEVLWSTAVQHGPYNDVFFNALSNVELHTLSEAEIIQKIYAERSRIENNQLVNFPRVGEHWQKNLLQRFKSEEKMALSRLNVFSPVKMETVAIDTSSYKIKKTKEVPPQEEPETIPEVHQNPSASPKLVIPSEKLDQNKEELISIPLEEKVELVVESYRVMFVVLKDKDVRFPKLKGVGEIFENIIFEDQVRYFIGQVYTFEEAKNLREEIKSRGYRFGIITRFKDDELIEFLD